MIARAAVAVLLAASWPALGAWAQMPLSAREVVARIQKHVGVEWSEQTVDTFKAGNPDAPVKGVAVTMMATLDVLKRAAAAGHTLVITHEPTFFDHEDRTAALETEGDPVFAAKRAFIEHHGLVVWRFHDHWHQRSPDGVQVGMIRALGWESLRGENDWLFTLPETTLRDLARVVRNRLGVRVMRVVGDPDMKVSRVAFMPGAPPFERHRRMLQRPDVEVLVAGEVREWETVEYVDDAVSAGMRKALILASHIPSEQAGMEECARWLRTFVSEVPVEFVPAVEPFWTVE